MVSCLVIFLSSPESPDFIVAILCYHHQPPARVTPRQDSQILPRREKRVGEG